MKRIAMVLLLTPVGGACSRLRIGQVGTTFELETWPPAYLCGALSPSPPEPHTGSKQKPGGVRRLRGGELAAVRECVK